MLVIDAFYFLNFDWAISKSKSIHIIFKWCFEGWPCTVETKIDVHDALKRSQDIFVVSLFWEKISR
jgi:hypothetical protein